MTRCTRCRGSVADIFGDGARCLMCGHDGTVLRAPTARDKVASRKIKEGHSPMRPIDYRILAGDVDAIDKAT